jgi:hypothetical protein
MGEIKSSWEIARQKADELGDLSEEEREKQIEDRCRPIGKSLADKYLGEQNISNVEKELDKYKNGDKELIRRIALNHLVDYIDIQNSFALDKVLLGILSLARKDEKVAEIIDRIRGLFHEYGEVEKVERQKIDTDGREMLHQQRISGTAIGTINIRVKEEWQKRLNAVAQPFVENLDCIKHELLVFEGCF